MKLPLCALCALTAFQAVSGCTTLVAGRLATADGSVLAAHSNDGDGDTPGNLMRVPAQDWPAGSERPVSGGSIPQVSHTYAYFTKVGGYASMNEYQVALAETTCVGIFPSGSAAARLNIVDLSALALERTQSARQAVTVMGALAEQYGYNDNAESLFVIDTQEAFIFHVLPDDTGKAAVWAAQRVPDTHVGVVANSFTIRTMNLSDADSFLFSPNMLAVAQRAGRWQPSQPFDFTRVFAGPEPGHKFAAGRRMWVAYSLLAPQTPFSPDYGDYVQDAPYPATTPAGVRVSVPTMLAVMRNSYQGTPFDMTQGLAAGAFGSPDRWAPGPNEALVGGNWERTIAIVRTIVSYVVQARGWLPRAVGGTLWFGPHAAHTTSHVPLPAGMALVPPAHANSSLDRVDRNVSAWQASRFVFNVAQLKFAYMIRDIQARQAFYENRSLALQALMDARYVSDPSSFPAIQQAYIDNAQDVMSGWWQLADDLMLRYADGYCHGCSAGQPYHLGYPAWWLRAVNFSGGPPPSPPATSAWQE